MPCEAWWSPFVGISLLGVFCLLMYLLRRRRRLVRVAFWAFAVLLLMFVGMEWPDDISPFESAFWRGIELRDWRDILRTTLYMFATGLIAHWILKSVDMPWPIGYGSRGTRGDCVINRSRTKRRRP